MILMLSYVIFAIFCSVIYIICYIWSNKRKNKYLENLKADIEKIELLNRKSKTDYIKISNSSSIDYKKELTPLMPTGLLEN